MTILTAMVGLLLAFSQLDVDGASIRGVMPADATREDEREVRLERDQRGIVAYEKPSDEAESTANVGIFSRQLQASTDFKPLTCPAPGTCKKWTELFGTGTVKSSRISIPCGQCVTMDHPGPTLTLNDGIDILGLLSFPDGYSLTMETTVIVVQGELRMVASKAVDGKPNVRFVMIGNADQSFQPAAPNTSACGGGVCNAGKKAIVVAGGKIDG
jgi:hypothetical protein